MITFQTIRNKAYRIICVCVQTLPFILHVKCGKTSQGHTLKCSEVGFMVDESTPISKETAQKYAYASNCQIPTISCSTGRKWRMSKLLLLCWQLWAFCRRNNRSNGIQEVLGSNFRQGIGNPHSYFPQLLRKNAGIVSKFGHNHFRLNPFQFIYHRAARCYTVR